MIAYLIFIRSFSDGNNDGIGDLKGITNKLDYLSETGIDAIWITPVNPSPSYHKYDITNYYDIDPECGSMQDFEELIAKAHKKNIKIVMDLVLNHCSWQHPFFIEAVSGKKNLHRDYFVWSDKKNIPANSDQWHSSPLKGDDQFYFGHFWQGMPDMNYDNAEVRKEAVNIAKFWIEKGVDGFRLDAARHIFPSEREEENHQWWSEFRTEIDKYRPGFYLVGEVADKCSAIAPYLKSLTSCFNFELSENIIRIINDGHHNGVVKWLSSVYQLYAQNKINFTDATFLSNHDFDRTATLLNNDIHKIKLAASILLTLPGDVYIYYGEELGMAGQKPDEYIREPFLWGNGDSSQAKWITPLYSTSDTIEPLNIQKEKPDSVYNHYKTLIAFRKNILNNIYHSLEPYEAGEEVFAYKIRNNESEFLMLHNLSSATVELNLAKDFTIIFQPDDLNSGSGNFQLTGFKTVVLAKPV